MNPAWSEFSDWFYCMMSTPVCSQSFQMHPMIFFWWGKGGAVGGRPWAWTRVVMSPHVRPPVITWPKMMTPEQVWFAGEGHVIQLKALGIVKSANLLVSLIQTTISPSNRHSHSENVTHFKTGLVPTLHMNPSDVCIYYLDLEFTDCTRQIISLIIF